MSKMLAPHIRTEARTGRMMMDILMAAIPLGLFSFVNYGMRPVFILLLSVLAAVVTEAICCMVGRRRLRTVLDGSAAITGVLIGLVMSPMVDYWVPMLGSAFAIIVAKAPFGGTGHSGMGAYHGEWGFREFTHPQTVLLGSTRFNLGLREHPYTGKDGETKLKILKILER